MPKELYDIRNYPKRSGTSQPQRRKPVLLGAEVKIDERTVADYIVFAQKLGRHIRYYNENNIVQGNWEPFLKNDITYQLAVTASDKIGYWNETWNELMEHVEADGGGAATPDDHKKYFTWRFDFLYTLVGKLAEAYAFSNSLPTWKNELVAFCSSAHIEIIFSLLKQYYASAVKFSLIKNDAGPFTYKDITLMQKDQVDRLLDTSDLSVTALLKLENPLFADTDFIFGQLVTIPEQVAAASEYLYDLAVQLINLYGIAIETAKKYLDITLNSFSEHQPHVGLFYAFLQLADEHRNEINGLLLKHLDFYYKQVLLVKEKAWQPDQAFVTFELAKNIGGQFIPAGSLLSAGKDSAKKDVFYKTLQDILVNKTELAEVKSFVMIRNDVENNENNIRKNMPGVFGCEAANSADGKGKPLKGGTSWETFRAGLDNTKEIGIAFYSALLHEAPGEERTFTLYVKFSDTSINNDVINLTRKYGKIKIETEKEPVYFSLPDAAVEGDLLKIPFTISGKTKLSKASPNASLIFGHKLEPVDNSFFGVIKMLQTASLVNLHIVLSAHEVKVTHVETAAGSTDLSSAFAAFGGVPKVGSSFSVIEPLLLNRKISNLSVDVEWEGKVEREYNVKVSYPSNSDIVRIEKDAFTSEIKISRDDILFKQDEIVVKLESNEKEAHGDYDLGHTDYANKLTTAIIEFTR